MIRDIIWDFDGTLFDTYPGIVGAFKEALKDNGIEETNEEIMNYMKISAGCAITHFKELYKLEDEFVNKFNFYEKNMNPEIVKPFPFAVEVCKKLISLGGRNYIITHRGNSTLKFLQHYDMEKYFNEIITKRYEFKRKPDPEAFIYLIEKYNMNKDTTLVVGDREIEILAGKASGIKSCLYDTNKVEFTAVPDFHIDSLKDLIDIID